MAYNGKTNWQLNEIVKPEDMNRIEQGIIDANKSLLIHNASADAHKNRFDEFVKGVTGSNATLTITKGNGTTSAVTVNNVANATNATNATKATQDSTGQQISTTYIKGLSASNATLTYTKGNGTTGTVTVNNVATATNADKVDGYHENSFLRYRGAAAATGEDTLWSQIGIKEYGGKLPKGVSGTYDYGAVVSLPAGGPRLDIWYNHGCSANKDGLWYRSGYGTDQKAWARLLDSNNYTNWAPTKTGSGASGTWGINISGNAASATKANTATLLSGFAYIDNGTWGHSTGTYITGFQEKGGGSIQWRAEGGRLYERVDGTFWQREGTYEVIDTSTVNNYAPTKTGGGASGTWGINISGNAVNDGNGANIANTYLKKSGGNMNGPLNFANGTWNLVGDDSYMGDHNIAGTFCVKGANGETGIALVNNGNESDYARISYGGGNINFNKKITANLAGTADNATQWNGLVNDLRTENNTDTWIPVLKDNKLQHTTKANMTVGQATRDSAGQQINTTYIKGLSVSGATLTITKGNGTTSTATINQTAGMLPATRVLQGGGTKLYSYNGGLDFGDITLSQAFTNFKYLVVFLSEDGKAEDIYAETHETSALYQAMAGNQTYWPGNTGNTRAERVILGRNHTWAIWNIKGGSSTTFFKHHSNNGARMFSIYGIN